jgi:hypothetical protein
MFCPRTAFSHLDTQAALDRLLPRDQVSFASAASTEAT